MDQEKLTQFFNARHEKYLALVDDWRKMRLAQAGGQAAKKEFLVEREREADKSKERRLKLSAYENLLADIIQRRGGIVFSRKFPEEIKTSKSIVLDHIKEDIDRQGNSLDVFVKEICFPLSQCYGYLPVWVDKGSEEAETEEAQEEGDLFPYAKIVLPSDMLNWYVGKDKALEWVLLRSDTKGSASEYAVPDVVHRFTYIDREKIEVWEEREGKESGDAEYVSVIGPVEHEIGRVPIEILYDERIPGEPVVGKMSLLNSCEISIAMFNEQSWAQNVAYKTNFSTLAAELTPEQIEQGKVSIGEENIFVIPEDAKHAPMFLSPDTSPLKAFAERVNDMRRRAYEQAQLDAGFAEDKREELSGIAYTIRRKDTEEMAQRLGQQVADFQKRLLELILRDYEQDANLTVAITAPKKYGVRATQDALAELKAIEELSALPTSVRRKIAENVIETDSFVEIDDEERKKLKEDIANYDPLAEEVEQTKKLEEARVEPQVALASKRIEEQKAYADKIAETNVEREKIRAESNEKVKEMELKQKLEETNRATEAERNKPKAEKAQLWG